MCCVGQGYIKTVKYVFYVNAPSPEKLVFINFLVNRLQNGRKHKPDQMSTQFCLYVFLSIWHYDFIFFLISFDNLAISNILQIALHLVDEL